MDDDDKRVAQVYTSLVEAHGESFRSLDWTSAENQTQRFKRLSLIGFESDDTVLDVGCGLGDFLLWLRENALGDMLYTGMDMTPAMIERAKDRFPHERFFVGNILDRRLPFRDRTFDWVVASGIFAHRKDGPWDYMKAVIQKMTGLARRGIAFNSQSTLAGHPQFWTLFHADPKETLAYCESFGWSTMMTHTPDRTDFTVYMWHPNEGKPDPRIAKAN